MAEQKLPKLTTRVRFPSPAPAVPASEPRDTSHHMVKAMQDSISSVQMTGAAYHVADMIIAWQRLHGRNDLPWQASRDAYAIWISEIMLQQTQVAAVIPYYRRFLDRFPDCAALAAAPLDEVLQHWSGLGYYSRARNLHKAAQIIAEGHAGRFPRSMEAIAELPGVGRSTGGAIAAFAFGARHAILDGNARRVFSRVFGIEGDLTKAAQQRALWDLAERLLPAQ